MYKGIDVSDNQGVIDWSKVAAAGAQFAVLRSVRRSGKTDYQFEANLAGCQQYNIPVSVYKYTYATSEEAAQKEAQQVVQLLGEHGLKCIVWWDVEDRDSLCGLGSSKLTACIQAAREVIEAAGLQFGLYTGLYVYREKWFDFSQFSDVPLWAARYYNSYNVMQFADDPDQSMIPDLGRALCGWQYTSTGRIPGVSGNVDIDICYYDPTSTDLFGNTGLTTEEVRQTIIDAAESWKGCKEADGSHRQIIDLYNSHKPLARGYAVQYTDSWCATFVSAAAIKAGLTEIVPTECSCGQMMTLFQKAGRWVEDDGYTPSVGDIIFYDWSDSGSGDNTGWPDHVGLVKSVRNGTITVIEGNKDDAVGYRTLAVNDRYIRGYGVPDYASVAAADAESAGSQTQAGAAEEGLVYANVAGFTSTEEACRNFHDFLAAAGMNTENWLVKPVRKLE